ncbi:thioesterase II family protein [Streptomyces canus]|uniref:thioesterase II family protein n=1 Tax=Streptomyces canus TaxID=58343 RepID=UPI002E26A4A2
MPDTHSSYFSTFRPAPDAPVRLICLPHAGGSASFYFPMARALAPGVEVMAVQYPGRQERRGEPFVPDVATLADQIAEALRPLTDRPYALFGHSMGSIVGFEVARRLETMGNGPAELFASGGRAPCAERRGELWHRTPDDEFVRRVKSMGGAGTELLDDPDMRDMLLPALRNDYRAIETYEYQPQAALSCPVTVFTGDADPRVSLGQARAWASHTGGAFTFEVLPGGHFFLVDNQSAVLRTVVNHLNKIPAPC